MSEKNEEKEATEESAEPIADEAAPAESAKPEADKVEAAAASPADEGDLLLVVEEDDPPFTPLNWALIVLGLILMGVGFLLLRQADSQATNWQSIWAPMLILGSYVLVFFGIIIVRRAPDADEINGE